MSLYLVKSKLTHNTGIILDPTLNKAYIFEDSYLMDSPYMKLIFPLKTRHPSYLRLLLVHFWPEMITFQVDIQYATRLTFNIPPG